LGVSQGFNQVKERLRGMTQTREVVKYRKTGGRGAKSRVYPGGGWTGQAFGNQSLREEM